MTASGTWMAALAMVLTVGGCKPERTVPAGAATSTEGTGAGNGSAPGSAATTSPADTGLVQGTPEGGLQQWIGDVRAGLDTLPALAERDPSAAKNQALTLYVSRQEYIEIYYGTAGRVIKDATLAETVTTAETRFHELLKVVNTPDGKVDVSALRQAASALSAQYDRVLERARALGVNLGRPVVGGGAA